MAKGQGSHETSQQGSVLLSPALEVIGELHEAPVTVWKMDHRSMGGVKEEEWEE